jgi:kynurenine formamidase
MSVMDRGHYNCGKGPVFPGSYQYADDVMFMYLQGSTQYDALGHVWYDDQIWNGYDADTTIGGLAKASVCPIGERGVVGRGILIDMARYRKKDVLDPGETFTHVDLMAAAKAQGVTIEKRDILIIRTGWIGSFYKKSHDEFYANFKEPGLTYSPELVHWFQEMEIPNLVTDTIANEVTSDPVSGVDLPLHNALMRNLGITLTEIAQLDPLADDCAADGQYTFLYTAAPLKVVGGTGAPVNPIVLK